MPDDMTLLFNSTPPGLGDGSERVGFVSGAGIEGTGWERRMECGWK